MSRFRIEDERSRPVIVAAGELPTAKKIEVAARRITRTAHRRVCSLIERGIVKAKIQADGFSQVVRRAIPKIVERCQRTDWEHGVNPFLRLLQLVANVIRDVAELPLHCSFNLLFSGRLARKLLTTRLRLILRAQRDRYQHHDCKRIHAVHNFVYVRAY